MTSEPRSAITTIKQERFAEICSKVWLDRTSVLTGRGLLSGEEALVRAVYWRLRNLAALPAKSTENYGSPQTVSDYRMGVGRLLEINGHPNFDCSLFIDELLHRYEHESDRLEGKNSNQKSRPGKALGFNSQPVKGDIKI